MVDPFSMISVISIAVMASITIATRMVGLGKDVVKRTIEKRYITEYVARPSPEDQDGFANFMKLIWYASLTNAARKHSSTEKTSSCAMRVMALHPGGALTVPDGIDSSSFHLGCILQVRGRIAKEAGDQVKLAQMKKEMVDILSSARGPAASDIHNISGKEEVIIVARRSELVDSKKRRTGIHFRPKVDVYGNVVGMFVSVKKGPRCQWASHVVSSLITSPKNPLFRFPDIETLTAVLETVQE